MTDAQIISLSLTDIMKMDGGTMRTLFYAADGTPKRMADGREVRAVVGQIVNDARNKKAQ